MEDQNNFKISILEDLFKKTLNLNEMYIGILKKEKEKIIAQKESYIKSKEN